MRRQSSIISCSSALCCAPVVHSSVFWKCATELMERDICALTTDLKRTLYHRSVLKLVTSSIPLLAKFPGSHPDLYAGRGQSGSAWVLYSVNYSQRPLISWLPSLFDI